MKKILFTLAILFSIFTFSETSHAALAFPANDPGIDISRDQNNNYRLDQGYEPSGIVWHSRLQSLFMVWDNGYVTQMDIDGNVTQPSVFAGPNLDLEDITIVDEESNFVYLLQEYPQQIIEFDIASSTQTGQRWNLLGMPGNARDGAEALTYNKSTHEFYVGAQSNGQIYVYNVDLNIPLDPNIPGNVNFSRIIETGIPNDIAGLNYSDETNHVYALFDGANKIQEYDSHDLRVAEFFNVPGNEQEGLVILPGCPNATAQIVIAEDAPMVRGGDARVMKYNPYPLACIPSMTDNDRDGFMADVDCNDNNAAVHPGAVEILNDGINNDCSSRTPDSVRIYDSLTLRHPFVTEIRHDYHVFDNIGEYSFIQIPANLKGQWYSFELEARANSLDQLYSMGIYIPQLDLRHVDLQVINRDVWKTYTFTKFIPANTPVEVRFISDVTGKRLIGGKREHHLRSVKVTRLEQIPNQFLIR